MRLCILTVLVLTLFFVGCGKKKQSQPSATEDQTSEAVVKVVVTQVQKHDVAERREAYGHTIPFKQIEMYSKVNGLVLKKTHQLAEQVQKGDLLAVVRQDIPGMEFADHQVKANLSGVILKDFTEVGATVTISQPLFTIAQINPLLAEIKVPEEWLARIPQNRPVRLFFESWPNRPIQAKIFRILPQNDLKTRSAILQLKIPNEQGQIKVNTFVKAQFEFERHSAITIPVDALVRSGLEYFVFKVENNVVHKQLVEPGNIMDGSIEIVKGLSAGETVVVFGQNLLDDGVKVEVEEIQ